MIRALIAIFRRPPANDNARWDANDERALQDAKAGHGRTRSLAERKTAAVHEELARAVWGGRGWRRGSMAR